MKRFTTTLLLAATALVGLVPAGINSSNSASAAPAAQAGFADAAFQRVWDRTDSLVASGQVSRSWFWGPEPLTMMSERYNNAKDGSGQHLVQYFDKARMEINDPSADPNSQFYVTNGLLTVELISGRMQIGDNDYEQRAPADIVIAGDTSDNNAPTYASFAAVSNAGGDHPNDDRTGQKVTAVIARNGSVSDDPSKATYPKTENVHYEPATHHNIPAAFWDFLNAVGPVNSGGLKQEQLISPWFYASGYPISDAYWANVKIDGKPTDVLIQAYERRTLTYIPSFEPDWQVQMGNIGAHYRDWRYKGPGRVGSYPLSGPHPGYGFNVWLFDIDPTKTLQATTDAGFGWVRQQIVWADYQKTPARIDWARLDPIVAAVNAKGLKLMLSIVRAPAWATKDGKGGMPDDQIQFGGFMEQMVARYKGRVAAYEIWNEQNLQAETSSPVSVGPYVELLRVGYSAVKFEDPNAIVVFGGLTPTGLNNPNIAVDDTEYLKQFYAFGGGFGKNFYDVLGAHPGSNNNSPDQLWSDPNNQGTGDCPAKYQPRHDCWQNHDSFYFRRIEEQRAVMEANGEGAKQMWLTEFGWSTANQAPGYEYGDLISPELQAQYLVRAFQKGKNDYPWMGTMFVWNLNFSTLPWLTPADEKYPWSVLNADFSPRPAYTALQQMAK